VPSTRVGMVRLMILSRGNKDSNIVFSAGRFATMLTVPTQSIFCQLIPSTSERTKGGNFSAMASDKLAELLLKCFHAPTPRLHSDCIYLSIFLCCIWLHFIYQNGIHVFLYRFCIFLKMLFNICLTNV
jgi:hypothetical protein